MMMNLYSLVTPYPKELKESNDPLRANNHFLKTYGLIPKAVVFCWGSFDVGNRDKEVMAIFPNAKALVINKNGSPRHPLYVPKDTQLIDFKLK